MGGDVKNGNGWVRRSGLSALRGLATLIFGGGGAGIRMGGGACRVSGSLGRMDGRMLGSEEDAGRCGR
jgi:hypothetical protein